MCVGRVPWYCGGGDRAECIEFCSSRRKPECRSDVLGALKNSPGRWRAVPYTRSAGEHSASSCQAVRIPSKTIGNSSTHLGPVRRALREAFNCRCNLSTRPFAWGWEAVVLLAEIPRSLV